MQQVYDVSSLVAYLVSYLVRPHKRTNHPVGQGLSGLAHEKAHLDLNYCDESISEMLIFVHVVCLQIS